MVTFKRAFSTSSTVKRPRWSKEAETFLLEKKQQSYLMCRNTCYLAFMNEVAIPELSIRRTCILPLPLSLSKPDYFNCPGYPFYPHISCQPAIFLNEHSSFFHALLIIPDIKWLTFAAGDVKVMPQHRRACMAALGAVLHSLSNRPLACHDTVPTA